MLKRRKSVISCISFSWKRAVDILCMSLSLACIIVVLYTIFSPFALAEYADHQFAQVVTKQGSLNMRKAASSKADIVEKIPQDTILEVTRINDTWCECSYNNHNGYVMSKYLSFLDYSQFQTLQYGDSNQDVLALKVRLLELYYFSDDVELDDTYTSDTETAIKAFQAANDMQETGIASPELQALINWGNPKNNLPTKEMTITIKSSCSSYNHVGQNWSRYYSINGESISSGDTLDIVLGESMTIYSKVTEKDTSPDVGSVKEELEITQDYFDNGFTITHSVGVREDKGKYSGNKAVWTITYTFSP